MSLSFLVPAFLIGLAALAIPVLIHLTRRQTKEAVAFPSLMFVQRVPHRTTRRRQVRNWPLLLLRCAALALLALAFARPFLSRGGASILPVQEGGREVVILLDRSYSMGYGDRWERAVRSAAEAIDGLRTEDRGTLVLFDSRTEAVTPSTADHAVLRAALGETRPGPRATRYAPALRHAERLLSASSLPQREVVLVSDFQRGGWETDAAEAGSIRLPPGTKVTPRPITDAQWANVTVASASFRRSLAAGRERVNVTARLTSQGDAKQPSVPVTLELDGRPLETRTVALQPNGSATVEFAPFMLPESGSLRGTIRASRDALAVDDAFHFVLSPDQRIGVLIVEGAGARGSSYYLTRALAIGDAPGFRAEVRPVGELRAADLEGRRVVILNQAPLPGGELGQRLRSFVEGGGGLVLVLGDGRVGEWEGVVPGGIGGSVDHTSGGGTSLGHVDFGHPVFEPFSVARSGDFTAARVYRYREVAPAGLQRVLARFGDGSVALAEQKAGSGRLLVWTSTLDNRWNDLVLQPVFLPFLHTLTKYAAGYASTRPWLTVGEPFDVGGAAPAATLALAPSGQRIPLQEATPLAPEEVGFYELRDRRSGAKRSTFAVNVDPGESALEAFDPQDLVSALLPSPSARPRVMEEGAPTLEEGERQQRAWWYLVVLALLLLAVETVWSNRVRAAGPTPAR